MGYYENKIKAMEYIREQFDLIEKQNHAVDLEKLLIKIEAFYTMGKKWTYRMINEQIKLRSENVTIIVRNGWIQQYDAEVTAESLGQRLGREDA